MTMTSTTTAPSAPLSRDESGTLLGQTMGLVALTAGLFALGAYIGRDSFRERGVVSRSDRQGRCDLRATCA
jgi:hypothetical protein